MQTTTQQVLSALVEPLTRIARQAGTAIMAIYERDPAAGQGSDVLVQTKADDSPLTLADLAAHQVIAQALASAYPEIPLVSEEGREGRSDEASASLFWLVDPLDGTKEFLARNGEFTVNIALIEAGCPVFGVVHVPVTGETYWGGKGLGAFRGRDGKVEAIHVAAPVPAGGRHRVVASKSHLNSATQAFIEALGSVELIQAGSSLKFCRVAEGAAEIYPRLAPTSEWDTAAAQAVLEGAGGVVVDLAGKSLVYGKRDILNPSFIAASVHPGGDSQ